MADYDKILSILRKCTSTEVSEAEDELNELILQDVQILDIIQQILRDVSLPKSIILIAISTINSAFSSNISHFTSEFSFNFFSHLLQDPSIQIWSKKELSRSIMNCIDSCSEGFLTEWKNLALAFVMDECSHDVGLMIFLAFCCVDVENNLIHEIDEKPFNFSMKLTVDSFNSLNDNEVFQSRFESWKTIIEYMIHFECETSCDDVLMSLADSEYLTKALEIAYKEFSTGNNYHYLFINDEDYEMTEKINEMKKTVLEFHQLLLSETMKQEKRTLLYEFTGLQIEIYINSLCYSSLKEDFINDYGLEDVLIEMLRIVRTIAVDNPSILKKGWKQFIHYVLFPFLRINSSELEFFEEDTNSYVEISEDCCEKQKLGILKTEASLFLEKLSDNSKYIISNDESLLNEGKEKERYVTKYILRYSIASIEQHLQISNIHEDELFVHEKIPDTALPLTIETGFLVLSIFSYCLDDYPEEIKRIEQILSHQMILTLAPLEKARIFTFLAYNYDEIFTTDRISIKNWINYALQEQSHMTVSYCALDFLTNSLQIVYDEGCIMNIIQRVNNNTSTEFWNLLKKMTEKFMMKLTESTLLALVNEIFLRIEKEVNSFDEERVKITFVITSLLHTLRSICQKLDLFEKYPLLLARIEQVSMLYSLSLKYYFEDDVVKIMNCFLFYSSKKESEIHEFHNFLPQFAEEFENHQYEQTFYFVSFNCMLMKGEFETTVLPIFLLLKNSLIFHIQQSLPKKEKNLKMSIGHTFLLLQNILALYGSSIPIEELKFISAAVESFYPTTLEKTVDGQVCSKIVIYDKTLLARALNLQFLCYLFTSDSTFLENLKKFEDFEIFYGYDMSVLISCFRVLFCQENETLNLNESLHILISFVDTYFIREAEIRLKYLKQKEKIKKENRADEKIEEEEENEESESEYDNFRVTEYETILAEIDTPFMKQEKRAIGEFNGIKNVEHLKEEVIDMLKKLNDKSSGVSNSVLNNFPQETIEKLWKITSNKSIEELCEPKRKIYKVLDCKKGEITFYENVDDSENRGIRNTNGCLSHFEEDEELELYKGEAAKKKKQTKQKM